MSACPARTAGGHVLASSRGAGRSGDRSAVCPDQPHQRGSGAVRDHRQPAVGSRGGRVRVRLQPRRSEDAGDLGGAVRRFRERRAGHHRPVPVIGRSEMAAHERPRAAPAARLRGPGAGAFVGTARTLSAALRRGQHAGLQITTAANYFHALRRQIRRKFRKPLVVVTPKSLLRAREVASPLEDFGPGTNFHRVIGENEAIRPDDEVRRVVLCSGKIYFDLLKARAEKGDDTVALVASNSSTRFRAEASARCCGVTATRKWYGARKSRKNGRLGVCRSAHRAGARGSRYRGAATAFCRPRRGRLPAPACSGATCRSRRSSSERHWRRNPAGR